METKEEFWMIYCENGNSPTYKHISLDSALTELNRLCIKQPNTKFYILAPVAKGIGIVETNVRITKLNN